MYELIENKRGKTIKHMFTNKSDYEDYADYLYRGLRIVRWSPDRKTFYFNNGAVCFVIKVLSTGEDRVSLHLNNRCTHNKRLTKKYAALIEDWRRDYDTD